MTAPSVRGAGARPFQVVAPGGVTLHGDIEGGGRDLIWAHGLGSSRSEERRRGLFEWASSSVRVTRYDARGHGRSTADEGTGAGPHDPTWANLAADLLAVADGLGMERFAAGGTSLGCATALLAALLRPDAVDALVLVTPPAVWADRPPIAADYRAGAELLKHGALEDLRRLLEGEGVAPILQADPDQTFVEIDAVGAHAFAAILRGVAESDLPPPGELEGVTAPALVLAWSEDADHPVSSAAAIAARLDGARLVVASDLREVRTWPHLVARFLGA